jgi:hypothetical protein
MDRAAKLGDLAQVPDGDPPLKAGGSPLQTGSLGELIRVYRVLDYNRSQIRE